MAKIKISVIVPVYNRENVLRTSLDAVIKQTLKDIEIICINDGSTDSSLDILKEYASKDSRIIIINQSNQGPSVARNKGIEIANGEFIGFVDSDDIVSADFFEKLYSAASKTNSDIACASIYNEKEKQFYLKIRNEKIYKRTSKKYIAANLPFCCYVYNKIYRTEKIKKYNCYFEKGVYYEDMPWTFRTLYLLEKMVTVPQICYHYILCSNSIVKQNSQKHRADYIHAVEYIQNFVYEHNIKVSIKSWKGKFNNRYYISFLGLKLLRIEEFKFAKCYYLFGIFRIAQVRKLVNTDLLIYSERDL